MRLAFFFTISILTGICLSSWAQDTLRPARHDSVTTVHRIDTASINAPGSTYRVDSATALKPATDTVNVKNHSPLTAALASAILPGAGQFYNKKYWKIPILYAGAAVDIYFIVTNLKNYNQYRQAYIASIDGTPNIYASYYTAPELLSIQAYYQKYYDLSIIIGVAIYAINILDAIVDAHLYYFDISRKLSMTITPTIDPLHLGALGMGTGTGLALQLHF